MNTTVTDSVTYSNTLKFSIFKIDDYTYILNNELIPKDSILEKIISTSLHVDSDDNGEFILPYTQSDFEIIYKYITKGILPKIEYLHIFDYFNISELHSYKLASLKEEYMRNNMYQKGYETHEMNCDPYYGLIKIDEIFWNKLTINRPNDNNYLFDNMKTEKQEWLQIKENLKTIDFLFEQQNIFVAGGRIYSALFGSKYADTDIFIYNSTEWSAKMKIFQISNILKNNVKHKSNRCTRTSNAITFTFNPKTHHNWHKDEYQIILRLYNSPSEILHGFDVDCCSIGYDGKDIWITQRALFSIINGYNTVNFDRLSPSYNFRLAKYALKGMAIKIPNFDKNKVIKSELENYFNNNKRGYNLNMRYKHIKKLNGLDVILYLEYYYQHQKHYKTMLSINKLDKESSDYSALPYSHYNGEGLDLFNVLSYLNYAKIFYPKYSKSYMPYIIKLSKLYDIHISDENELEKLDIDGMSILNHNNTLSNKNKNKEYIYTVNIKGSIEDIRILDLSEYTKRLNPYILSFFGNIKNISIIDNSSINENSSVNDDILYDSNKKYSTSMNLALDCNFNNFFRCSKITFIKADIDNLAEILDIPIEIYKCLEIIRPWDFPAAVTFKTTQPGEQMTNTFNKLVLEDTSIWYKGMFYRYDS